MAEENDRTLTDELLDGLIRNVKDLEGKVTGLPDHTKSFEQLEWQLTELKAAFKQQDISYPAEQIQRQLEELQKKVSVIPNVIPVRHHFDVKTKGFITGAAILLVTVAIAVGVAISAVMSNSDHEAGSEKFRMVRQIYPQVARWADQKYHNDPVQAVRVTDSLEALSADMAAAEREAKAQEKVSTSAKDKVKRLRSERKRRRVR